MLPDRLRRSIRKTGIHFCGYAQGEYAGAVAARQHGARPVRRSSKMHQKMSRKPLQRKDYWPDLPSAEERRQGGRFRLLAGSSLAPRRCLGCRACGTRACAAGGAAWRRAAAGSSAFMARRWPSNTVVSQGRSFSIRPAQIFAAAAASLSGPATSRSCMPSPLLPSLITMIGRNVVSAAFDLDFRSPRHSARKPGSELAPPTSTPNSVRWTAELGRRRRLHPARPPRRRATLRRHHFRHRRQR